MSITNTGAAHYIPTVIPDRHLTLRLRVLDRHDNKGEKIFTLKRTVLWRLFIVGFWDTRLPLGEQRDYVFAIKKRIGAAIIQV